MSARFYYRDDAGDIVELVDKIPREGWEARENAEEGSTAMWTLPIIDADMDLDFVGHRRWMIIEDESEATDSVLAAGFAADQEIGREGGEYVEPLGRVWQLSMADMNSLWGRRVLVGSDCKRPAETDVERMQWLVDTNEMGYFDDLSLLSTAGPVNMDACDYRGQYVQQVADDCAQASGKNWWIALQSPDLGTTRNTIVWYGADSGTAYSSSLSLSNDPNDWVESELEDGTSLVWPISFDTKLRRDPSRVYSGVYLPYDGGAVYRKDAATVAQFAVSGRDMSAPSLNVKSKAKAIARANRYLADLDTQDERITTTVELPAAKATMIRAGMRIMFKATHLPNYTYFHWMRVLSCAIRPVAAGTRYRLTLELQGPGSAVGGSRVFALLSSRDDSITSTETIPSGWTMIKRYFPDNAGTDIGLALAWGPSSGSQTISMTHSCLSTSFNELFVAQLSNLDPDGIGTPATNLVAGGSTGMSIDVESGGTGIVLVGIRINNFDSGGTITGKPSGFVTIDERYNTGGSGERDWGVVLWGYKPVTTSGTVTLSFTASDTFADWYKVLVGVWIPSVDTVATVQDATSGEVLTPIVSATLPSPL